MNIKNIFYATILFGFLGNSAVIFADDHNQNSKCMNHVILKGDSGQIIVLRNAADSIIAKDTRAGALGGFIAGAFLGKLKAGDLCGGCQAANALCGGIVAGLIGAGLGYWYGTTEAMTFLKEAEKSSEKREVALKKELNKQN
jgi:hypothetical protein